MIIKQLASGSKGNVTLVVTKKHNILIDAGLPLKKINERLEKGLPSIDMILITHTHDDHIKGLKSYIKEYNPKIYTKTKELVKKIDYENIIYDDFEEDNLSIKFFPLSHDTPCSGIIIKEDDKELVYITDTGYINNKTLEKLINKDIYIMESNHDVEKLRNGKYPFFLQQRILGDRGHLSNETASKYLLKLVGDNTKTIVLAHLSEENNTEDLALSTINNIFNKENKKISKLYIAKQDEALEKIEV